MTPRESVWSEGIPAPALPAPRPSPPTRIRVGRLRLRLSGIAENALLRVALLAGCFAAALLAARNLLPAHGASASAFLLRPWTLALLASQLLVAWAAGLFHPLRTMTVRRLLGRLAVAAAFAPAVLLVLHPTHPGLLAAGTTASRSFAVGLGLLAAVCLALQRLERRRRERILFLGRSSETEHFLYALRTLPSDGHPAFPTGSPDLVVRDQPVLEQAERLIREIEPDRVYVVRQSLPEDDMFRLLESASSKVAVYVVPSTWDSVISRLALGPALGDQRTFEIRSPLADPLYAALKRAFDIASSLLLLAALAPLFALLAVLVRLDSAGPALYVQGRVGRRGRLFRIFKFRSMRVGAEDETGVVLASENDARITRVGRWLRASRLDELPQLWNVLRGDMSLVGPRPERPELADEHDEDIPGYRLRTQVRPGITGLAQIYGRYQTPPREKLRYDLAYVYNYSLGLDLLLLLKTLWVMATRKGH